MRTFCAWVIISNMAFFCIVVQSLESELNGLLGKIRESTGTGAMKALLCVMIDLYEHDVPVHVPMYIL